MDNEISKVRTYFVNQDWNLAKLLLLKIHLRNKSNTTVLCKLGDCCMKLNEYDLAKQCYSRCIDYDKYYFEIENPKHYLKLAYVYQIYLDPLESKNDAEQLQQAKILFQKTLTLISQNENVTYKLIFKSYFYYAELLTKLKEYKA
eukprot:222763_1